MINPLLYLERRSLLFKLIAGFAVLVLTSLALGVFNLLIQRGLTANLKTMYQRELLGVAAAQEAQSKYLLIGREIRQALLVESAQERASAEQTVRQADAVLGQTIAELRTRVDRSENVQRLTAFDEGYAIYQRQVENALALIDADNLVQARQLVASPEYRAHGNTLFNVLEGIVQSKLEGAKHAHDEVVASAQEAMRLAVALLASSLLFSVLMGWMVSRSIRQPSERVRAAVDKLAQGKLDVLVPYADYDNEVGTLARSVQVLQTGARLMEEQSWLKTSLSQISNALQTASSFSELSQTLFSHMAPLVKIGHGAFYVMEEDMRRLRLLGGYAYRERKGLQQYFALGQGLVGQCALERTPIILTQPPADYVRIGSSLGEATPKAIAVLPIFRNDRLLGVLELATLADFGAQEQALLDGLMPILAVNVEILERSVKTRKLLEETQRQATEMRQQAATLEEQAEELEAQKNAIQATESWYRGIIESAPDGLLVADASGRITMVNARILSLFGYTEDELVGQAIEVLVPDSVRGHHPGLRTRFMETGGSREMGGKGYALKGRRKDGSLFPVEVGLSKLPAVGGREASACASIRDVTDRMEAEQALATSAQRLNFALTGGNLGLWDWDVARGRSEVNEIWAQMLGYTLDEVTEDGSAAAAWERLLHPDDKDEAHQKFVRCIEDPLEAEYQALFRMRAKSGGWRWILSMGRATERDTQGRALRFVGIHQDFTERKRLEEEMQRVNFQTDLALELTHCGYWHVDYSDPDHYYQSERAAAILGDPFKANGRYHLQDEWFSHVEAADARLAAVTAERYQGAVDGKYPSYEASYAYKRPLDGSIVWINAGGKVVRDDQGKPLFMYGAYQDVTALKESEQAILNSQRQLRTLVDSIGSVITMKDRHGHYQLINGSYEKLLGLTEAEVVGKDAHAFMPKAVADKITEVEERVMATGQAITYEEILFDKDGANARNFLTTKTPLLSPNGDPYGICGVATDITERKAQEESLKNANAEQTAMFEAATLGIAFIKDRVIVRCNRQLDALFGAELGAHLGQTTRSWYATEEDYQTVNNVYEQLARGETLQRDREMMRRDGTRFWCHLSGSAIDPANMARGTVWMLEDVTVARAASQAVERARQIAEEATKAKSDFLANMSHEIRTPMNAIIGMSHLALQTQLDKKQRNYIEKVHRSGENLLGIINDILDFSKIEAGKMGMETIDFRLEDVMDNLANLVGLKADDKGLELLFNVAEQVPTALRGDPLRLGQILINLGNNAVKFTGDGEVVVGVDVEAEDAQGVDLHFWVKDSGIGMTAEQCGKMFQSFSQADASTTRKYGGTGLGLAISKNLVEMMQGRIWVESALNEGSTFHFVARFGVQLNPRPRRMYRADELLGVRVLVVDDNASAREILSTMAKNFGLEVDTAWDGREALRMVAEADKKHLGYDLVLMDWKMPEMDGVETMHRLKNESLNRMPTVIMVTAYGREEAVSAAQTRGVAPATVLTKPVTSSTLLEAVAEALGKAQMVETRAVEKAGSQSVAMEQLFGARVLLVEDNELNLELAIDLLGNAHMAVVTAGNGQEALDMLARDADFDGVLMDCQMPVMDGYMATREIRKNPAFKDLPIIAMTANAMAGDREKVIEAGMWDHIAKPLNVANMFGTIAKWVKRGAHRAVVSPIASAAAMADHGLPPLPGIDVTRGLATTMDNPALYRRLLVKFRDSQANFAEQFAAARQGMPDAAAAQRLAHTLKGNAGNIGAVGVQTEAGHLEEACLQDADAAQVDALLGQVVRALAPVIAGLEALGTGSAPTPGVAAQGTGAVDVPVQTLNKLSRLLAQGDAEAADLVDTLLTQVTAGPLADTLRKVASALSEFDFDAALAAFQKTAGEPA